MSLVAGLEWGFAIMLLSAIAMTVFGIYLRYRDAVSDSDRNGSD